MWWISLLTLYPLQVNNYYSCFIVAESIPGYCHLPTDKRLGFKLLFCFWSNVTHFMIHSYDRKCEVLWDAKVCSVTVKNKNSNMKQLSGKQFGQSLYTTSAPFCVEIHACLRTHVVSCCTSLSVSSESSVTPTLRPCGLDQSVVIMLIWAVSHWEKKEGVKSCVFVCVVGLHLSECDYCVRSLWNSLCINIIHVP